MERLSVEERIAILEKQYEFLCEIMNKMDNHIAVLNDELGILAKQMGEIVGQQKGMDKILKYVVIPLIILVGALAGVELILP